MARNDFVFGSGWAGSIRNAGFKGELTWFRPLDDSQEGAFETFLVSLSSRLLRLEGDCTWNGSFLINTGLDPVAGLDTFNNLNFDRLDTKRVLPFPYATFLQASYPVTPLLTTAFSWMTFPGEESFFLNPTLTASVFSNLDLDVIGQIFYEKKEEGYEANSPALFMRVKWSF